MKKILLVKWNYCSFLSVVTVFLLLTSLIVLYSNLVYYRTATTSSFPTVDKVIIIDAGHGGIDPGKVGMQGKNEQEINLMIAQKLKRYFQQSGAYVILTREDDKGLYDDDNSAIRNKKREDLSRRRELVNSSEGDLFISIHVNSFPVQKYYGAQVFYLKGDEEGEKLAKSIQSELIRVIDRGNKREVKPTTSYYILKELSIPSVLVECGFLSNPEEEMLLNKQEYQESIAWSIYTGVIKYFLEEQLNTQQ